MKDEIERLRQQVKDLKAEVLMLQQNLNCCQQESILFHEADAPMDSVVAVRESEQRLRIANEAARIGTYMTNLEADRVYWSPELCDILGVPHGIERTNEEAYKVVHEDDRERVLAKGRDGSDPEGDGCFCSEHRVVRPDGEVRWILWRGRTIFRETGSGRIPSKRIGACVDITERKQAEDALRESEERYRLIVESAIDAILVLSGDIVAYANPAAVKLFRAGHVGELIGRTYLDLVHPEDRAESAQRIRGGCITPPGALPGAGVVQDSGTTNRKSRDETGMAPPREHRILTLDGRTVHVESTGVPIHYKGGTHLFGVFRDITARKQAEETLRETEKKYRELAESLPQVIFEIDLNGSLTYINRTGYELFGYTPEEIAGGFNVLESIMPEDRERAALDIMLNIQGRKLGRRDYAAIKKDGTKFPIGIHASPIMSGSTATGLRGILIDLTAAHRADEEKKKLEIQLQQAQKMEAIGALAGGIAHDFNNILAAIIGYTELAMLNEAASDCASELNQALIAANRAKELVKQILAFSRQTDEEKMPIRVGLVAEEAVKFIRATIPTTIEIKTRIDENSGTVLANSVELHQIIMNLCTNAVHAMVDQAGVLEIEVQNADIDVPQKHSILDLQRGPYVRLSVKDTGTGMTPDIVERIFDPYFTTKAKGVGTGLGLAVVHGIVKKSGGAIRVETKPGKGTAFHVYMPEVDLTAPIRAEDPNPIVGGSERILLLDDEKMLVDIVQHALRHLGYEVVSRTNPTEALELFKSKPAYFDLVVTDQTMPDMTGDAFARELMSIRPDIPVIICTGYSQAVDHERARQLGVKAFVMKPFLIKEMAAAVRKVLEMRSCATKAIEKPILSG